MKERSPVDYSLNLFQQLDKDILGTIKRGIEELEKTKVAKCNQEGYCENCGTKYTQIMTVDAKRKRRFQIKTQRLVRERESADEEDQIFNNQRFEQVNANNTAKMGSEVWQNLHEGTDCPQEFHKKVYAHNDRLVKDTSNAQEANQQTCRQCKNRFMCEQNYISDYVRDAHQKHEFHKKQIYEHEPKESGEVDSMNEINNSINEAICDYNNHAHDVQSPHQKQIYEHEFQQHEPKEKKVNQTFNLNNTINEAICDYNNHAHDVQFPHQKQIYEYEPKIDAAIDEVICDYNNHVHDSKFPLQKQIYEHEREVDSMNAINNSINEAINNYAHDVQFPHQKQIYEHEPKIDAAIDEASDYNNHVHDVQFLQFPSQKQIYEREPNINNDCNNHAHDVQKQTYEYEPKASGEVNSMNEINNTINEAICDYNNHVYDVQFPLQKQIYKHEPKEKGDIDATNRPGYCYNNGTEKKDIKAFGLGLIKETMEIYALDGQDYETINLGPNIFRETLAKDYPRSQKRVQFKLGHCYDKVETETLKLIKRLNHSQDDILDAKQILNVLRFHTYSLFKNVFHNGIRKKLAFTINRKKRRNRRRYNPNLSRLI
ncbi:unnamed protein product [Rhizophagus irregularis]|uniref:Uncharacterized protein n=1 Tax=Rhizophagus irregularis TaxID=588596 RepID=A0A915ZDX0_9GLOM|nr:unnamed protein product [Rhizophagus irregularis]